MFGWLKRLGLGAAAVPLVAQGSAVEGTTRVVKAGNFRIEVDLSGQVLGLAMPHGVAVHQGFRPAPTLIGLKPAGSAFLSAALLAQKGKQFDDGLYAAVELALQQGAGTFRGKRWLLEALTRELAGLPAPSGSTVPGILFGAGRVGGLSLTTPPQLARAVDSAVNSFQADQTQAKPLSFYTWSEDLRRIFLQDRMLQQELTGATEIGALAGALRRSGVGPVYEACLNLTFRLTNPAPADKPDLRGLLNHPAAAPPGKGLYFFPPSRAPETELVKRLFANRPIPEGFNLASELIAGLRAGSLDLQPRPDSGWYDLQAWALAPLVLTKKMPEGKRLDLDQSYVEQLEELFKALLALTRETHIKQLESPAAGAAAGPATPSFELSPELSLEPVFSYYFRRAVGYRFLRQSLESHFGAEALSKLHRLAPEGRLPRDLRSDLEEISALYYGASVTAARELGFPEQECRRLESLEISRVPGFSPAGPPALGSGQGAQADGARFRSWAQRCEQDPDLARDARMMVPLFYDVVRRKTKVWVFLGWTSGSLEVSFAHRPAIRVFDLRGRPADQALRITLVPRWYSLIRPVTAELYVSKLLDRREFQAFCNRHQTVDAIVERLGRMD